MVTDWLFQEYLNFASQTWLNPREYLPQMTQESSQGRLIICLSLRALYYLSSSRIEFPHSGKTADPLYKYMGSMSRLYQCLMEAKAWKTGSMKSSKLKSGFNTQFFPVGILTFLEDVVGIRSLPTPSCGEDIISQSPCLLANKTNYEEEDGLEIVFDDGSKMNGSQSEREESFRMLCRKDQHNEFCVKKTRNIRVVKWISSLLILFLIRIEIQLENKLVRATNVSCSDVCQNKTGKIFAFAAWAFGLTQITDLIIVNETLMAQKGKLIQHLSIISEYNCLKQELFRLYSH